MKACFLVVLLAFGTAFAAPKEVEARQMEAINYETDQGQVVDSRRFVRSAQVQDTASYMAPDGSIVSTGYIPEENGYVSQGDHHQQIPEISEEIKKGLDTLTPQRTTTEHPSI